mmetsp:Transcript_3544/g.7104  ORF Transcript_3544/g.7104 Transcript_3544/m.7104 type:complete len:100 (+) Transcript_3544:346-645(+)
MTVRRVPVQSSSSPFIDQWYRPAQLFCSKKLDWSWTSIPSTCANSSGEKIPLLVKLLILLKLLLDEEDPRSISGPCTSSGRRRLCDGDDDDDELVMGLS